MEIVFTVLIAIYGVLLVLARKAWDKIPEIHSSASDYPGVSMVIPVRNEEINIKTLINSLNGLKYPREKLEIIIVDDDSQDGTAVLIERMTSGRPEFKLFTLKGLDEFKGSYKKRALTAGIEAAKFQILVTTDADCQFHPMWLTALIGPMCDHNLVMATGPVVYFKRGTWSAVLDIEFASLVAVGAVSLSKGFPNMCNGANLAFSKEAFNQVQGYKGYEHVASGDDEFLLYKIFKHFPKQVRFIKNAEAIVHTEPPASWGELINQRKRWSSKWKIHQSKATRLLALFIFIFHLTLTGSVVVALTGHYLWEVLLVQLILKVYLEYLFVSPVLNFLGKKIPLPWFFLMQLLYSFYAIVIGLIAQFSGFNWKNRRYA